MNSLFNAVQLSRLEPSKPGSPRHLLVNMLYDQTAQNTQLDFKAATMKKKSGMHAGVIVLVEDYFNNACL